ncbi:MAG: spermidine synthase [Pseudohongiellaceae bacterium]|jgi:spermidine synthase
MQPRILLDEALTPDGSTLQLTSRSGYFEVSLGGLPLMSSSQHHSEEAMAELACEGAASGPGGRVMVGGLGMGYTLRAALDRLCPDGTVVVVELIEAVVRWNRGPLADLAERPLDDPRTHLEVIDLVDYLAGKPQPFDAILLDVDNGPEPFTTKGNARLYDQRGLSRLRAALRPGGTLVVWSVFESPKFVGTMQRAGFSARAVRARSRGKKGGRHTLYVGQRPS